MKKLIIPFLLIVLCFVLSGCNQTVKFDVNFIVDGEIYRTVGTSGNETIMIPENPTKDGYTFDGWYWDDGEWQKPFTLSLKRIFNRLITKSLVFARRGF